MNRVEAAVPNGPAAAAVLAAGIGSLVLGLTTTLGEASVTIGNLLNFYGPVGPLSGKTIVALAVWLIAWASLNGSWKDRDVDFGKAWRTTMALVILGLLGTFPLVFGLF